jgi:predicted nucleic acid-binding protein
MPTEQVIDASVVGAALFNEADSPAARRFLGAGARLLAPDLLFAEIASLSAKKVWRGEAPIEAGARALSALRDFVDEFIPSEPLAPRAFDLAARLHFSAYDGLYLALAESRRAQLVTLNERLIERARASELGHLVTRPD